MPKGRRARTEQDGERKQQGEKRTAGPTDQKKKARDNNSVRKPKPQEREEKTNTIATPRNNPGHAGVPTQIVAKTH